MRGSCEHLLLAYHVLGLEDFREAFGEKRAQKRRRQWGHRASLEDDGDAPQQAAPALAEDPQAAPQSPARPALTREFLEMTEKEMQKSIRKYEFFEESQKRRASRKTRL